MRCFIRALPLVLLAVGASEALADALPAPPEDCPAGSLAMSSHAGAYCRSMACVNDASCPADEGYTCEPDVGLCVEPRRVRCPDASATDDCVLTLEVVHGTCGGPGECAVGRCRLGSRCVKATFDLLPLLLIVGGTLLLLIVFFVLNRRRTKPSV